MFLIVDQCVDLGSLAELIVTSTSLEESRSSAKGF